MIVSSEKKAFTMPSQANIQVPSFIDDNQVFVLNNQIQNKKSIAEQEETQPNLDILEQGDPYVTSYVCLLAPRFQEHLLTGDLADQLFNWIKDICISFGWQLQFIDVKPNYLHWIMTVSISTYPTQFMKIVCQETSKKIFDDFPKFEQKNMSKEFWAPWYFVGVGQAPYSQNSIQSFIKQIRMEQGLL